MAGRVPRSVRALVWGWGALVLASASCIDFEGLENGPGPVVAPDDGGFDASGPATCEASVTDDPTNCGACGHVCAFRPNSIPSCAAGQCSLTCNTNFGNCDNQPENGCEISLATDGNHCGQCGRDCAGGACANGQCQPVVLATNQSSPNVLVLDAQNVYWAAYYSFTVDKLGKDGGTPITIAGAETLPSGIALDKTMLYWATRGYGGADGYLKRAPIAGGSVATIVGGLSSKPASVAVDANRIYYATLGDFSATGGAIASVPLDTLDAGAGTILAPQQNNPSFMTIDQAAVYWSNFGTVIAPDAGPADGSIVKCATPACAGGPQIVAAAQNHPRGITNDATTLYWANFGTGQNDGTIMKAPKSGGAPALLASNLVYPDGVAVDAKYLYFTTHSGRVGRIPLTGGVAEDLTTVQQSYPLAIAVDDKFLFFSTYSGPSGGTIQKLLK
jgi:hypothetical protein